MQAINMKFMDSFHALPLKERFPILFGLLIILTVSAPIPDLYKAFFHIVIGISVVLMLYRRESGIDWRDPLLCTALVLAAYASLATFVISDASLAENIRAFRWGIETVFFLITLFIVMSTIIKSPRSWGRFFCGVTILGSVIAIVDFALFDDFEGRLAGLGALTNPISAAAVLLVYWAIGTFMLLYCGQKENGSDWTLAFLSLAFVLVVTLFSESRGPLVALLVYILWFSITLSFQKKLFHLLWILSVVLILGLLLIENLYGLKDYVNELFERGGSYRLEIWSALMKYPPDSLIFGEGAGTSPMDTEAGKLIFEPMGLHVTHAHNLFIGTFTETGILGLLLLSGIIGLIIRRVVCSSFPDIDKLHMFGLLGLMLMLCMTTTHTLIISIKAVWFYSWLPLIFVWFWSGRHTELQE